MKDNLCKTLAFDCLVNDLMAYSKSECILSDEGFNTLKEKYNSELNEFIDEMGRQYELEKAEDEKRAAEYKETVSSDAGIYLPDIPDDELPFK